MGDQPCPKRAPSRRRFARVLPARLCFVALVFLGFRDTPCGRDGLAALSALTFTLNDVIIYVERVALVGHIVLALVAPAVRRWRLRGRRVR